MTRVQSQASLHPQTVTAISKGKVTPSRRRRGPDKAKRSKVRIAKQHPAYQWAKEQGIDPRRVEVTADPPLWGCIIHNQPCY